MLVPPRVEPCDVQVWPFQAAKKEYDPSTELYIDMNWPLADKTDKNAPSGSKNTAIVAVVNCYGSNRAREVCTISYGIPTSIAK